MEGVLSMAGLHLGLLLYPFKLIFLTESIPNQKIWSKLTVNSHFILLINDISAH